MSYKRIFWGVILITIGTLFILKNLDVVYFSWRTVWRLWPVVLILWGIAIIPVKSWIKLSLSVLTIIFAFTFFSNRYPHSGEFRFHKNIQEEEWEDQHINVPYDSTLTEASLIFDAAAGNFKIRNSTEELLEFDKSGALGNYSLTSEDGENSKLVKIKLENTIVNLGKKSDRVEMKINKDPVWNMNLDIGAASFNLDLRDFKMKKIDIDGGAASIKLKVGDLYPDTEIKIDAGASSIRISIPESSGCRIKTSTVLSSKSFRGFNKTKSHTYETDNYEDAEKKIYIELDAAVSSLNIIRYE
jgi:hypothetical protein